MSLKDNIKTAEEILYDKIDFEDIEDSQSIIEAMKEYASQFIDLAAEEARINYTDILYNMKEILYEYRGYEGYNDDPILVNINKESILKVKQLIK